MFHPPVGQQIATVTAHQVGELPKSESTQPSCVTTMVTLYISLNMYIILVLSEHTSFVTATTRLFVNHGLLEVRRLCFSR